MAIRRLYTRQDGKWAWQLVVDGTIVATDGGEGYANEAEAREIVNRILGGGFSDAEKRVRRPGPAAQQGPKPSANEAAADKSPNKQSKQVPAKKKAAQKPGAKASTSGQYQPRRGGDEVTVPKGHRLPPGDGEGEQWVNVDPTKNKSGGQSTNKNQPGGKQVPGKRNAAQKPGAKASTSGQFQPKRGGSEITVPKGHRLPPGDREGEQWVNVDPTKNKSGRQPAEKKQSGGEQAAPGKKTSSPRTSKASGKATRAVPTNAEVRAWAQRNGYTVSGRGPVPEHISTAYRAARRT